METLRRAVVCALLVISVSGVAYGLEAQESPKEAIRGAIDAGNSDYVAAYASRDPEALAGVYDPDGARLSGGGGLARGRAAIAGEVAGFMERVGSVQVRLETVEVWVVDDLAYETGVWSYTFTQPGATERTIGGRYVTVWRRQSHGGWRILADMGVPGTALPEGWRAR